MSDEDLPKESYGVEYDIDMYLANDRYASMVDDEIKTIKAAIEKANKELKKQHKKQNKSKHDYNKLNQKQWMNELKMKIV